jgi:copper chaperone NosL
MEKIKEKVVCGSTKGDAMKRQALCYVLIVFCLFMGSALWALDNDVREIPSCKYCGMNREAFAHSRMHIEYNDGSKEGQCSLHCAAVDLALNLDKAPKAIHVGDYGTKVLINAETAVWVIGGTKPGVMTRNAKWAFANKEDGEKFQRENGGRIAGFDDALEAAYKDLAEDTKMIRERRKMRKMQMMEHKP